MKTLTTLILSTIIFLFLGCEDIIIGEDNTTNSLDDSNISTINGAVPVKKSPVGSYVDLSEYFYPEKLKVGKNFYYNFVYNYSQTSPNQFTEPAAISTRSYSKVIIKDITRITEYKDDLQQKYDDVKRYKIYSYEKNEAVPKEYPIRVAKNSVIYDYSKNRVQTRCVVVSIGSLDLSVRLPLYVKNDLKNRLTLEDGNFKSEQFTFDDVMYIYCGTSDNHTTDSYYAKGYGKVLEVKKDIIKNLIKAEVVDVLSVKN